MLARVAVIPLAAFLVVAVLLGELLPPQLRPYFTTVILAFVSLLGTVMSLGSIPSSKRLG
jgi:hypothetical protein